MQEQSSSSDDSSLNITFFLALTASIFSLFIFSEGETAQKEGGSEIAVISSLEESIKEEKEREDFSFYKDNTLLVSSPSNHQRIDVRGSREIHEEEVKPSSPTIKKTMTVELTGYSSTVDQTNSQPFITASGARVRDGIVAVNSLNGEWVDFGTKIRIPEYFGEKEFVVKDRMNARLYNLPSTSSYSGYVDIWFESRQAATNFGRVRSQIEIIE